MPPDIRELRVRADDGVGFNPALEARSVDYMVVACLTAAFRRLLPGLRYQPANRIWEMAEFEHRSHGWPEACRFCVARRFIPEEEAQTTLFALGRYVYRTRVPRVGDEHEPHAGGRVALL